MQSPHYMYFFATEVTVLYLVESKDRGLAFGRVENGSVFGGINI